MEVLFLYQRLFHTAQKQLESLKRLDYGTLEAHTRTRDEITRGLCETLKGHVGAEGATMSASVRSKIRLLTAQTLDIDTEIKEMLLKELEERTVALAHAGLARE